MKLYSEFNQKTSKDKKDVVYTGGAFKSRCIWLVSCYFYGQFMMIWEYFENMTFTSSFVSIAIFLIYFKENSK